MAWLNRIGMLLEFLSFWFAAPEVVTEIRDDEGEWLRELERQAERGLRGCMWFIPWSVPLVLVGLVAYSFWGFVIQRHPSAILANPRDPWYWAVMVFTVLISSVFYYIALHLFVVRRIAPWLAVLADDRHIRRRWLKAGVVMFVVGFLLQFIATF